MIDLPPIRIRFLNPFFPFSYTMRYPETVKLKIELSRSAEWWGVFLNVIETFQAIKEDREYLLTQYNNWRVTGFREDANPIIEVATLTGSSYSTIYRGRALPMYEDDTFYFKTKFEENNIVTQFLDSSIEVPLNFEADSEQIDINLLSAHELINNRTGTLRDIFVDLLNGNPDDPGKSVAQDAINYDTQTQSVVTAQDNNFFNLLDNTEDLQELDYLFEDNSFAIPKNSKLTFAYQVAGQSVWATPSYYASLADIYLLVRDFSVDYVVIGEESLGTIFWSLLEGLGYNTSGVDIEKEYSNDTADVKALQVRGNTNDRFGNGDQDLRYTYRRATLYSAVRSARIRYKTEPINNNISAIRVRSLLEPYFEFEFENPILEEQFNEYCLFPFDGAITGASTYKTTINITELLNEVKKALSVGVTVDPLTNTLKIKYIPDLFRDEVIVEVTEENVFSLNISINENLKIGRLVLGAEDRDFNYILNNTGQNIKTTYRARNAFSGSLELNLSRYKSQMYDFAELYKEDIYELYSNERNDDEYCLFQNKPIRSINSDEVLRFNSINSGHTNTSQVAAWSWLLKTISPVGYELTSEANPITTNSPISDEVIIVEDGIEPGNSAFEEVEPVITLRTFSAQIKLTSIQYNAILQNRDKAILLNYRGDQYTGYINNLSIDIGVNILAEIELLEKR